MASYSKSYSCNRSLYCTFAIDGTISLTKPSQVLARQFNMLCFFPNSGIASYLGKVNGVSGMSAVLKITHYFHLRFHMCHH